jgi:hemerythrin-like domain-containing protein
MSRFDERRTVLRAAVSAAAVAFTGAIVGGMPLAARAKAKEDDEEGAEVTPGEDLMQEHGVLQRILLVYDAAAVRIERGAPVDTAVIGRAAGIVRRFVEDYHEKLEEQFVFPTLVKAGRENELVATLLRQHERGRALTDEIARDLANLPRRDFAERLRTFVSMYRPHAAREDTVVFPAFREVVGRNGYRELGEKFEDREHELFGKKGFEGFVREVADCERAYGIYDLSKSTPAVAGYAPSGAGASRGGDGSGQAAPRGSGPGLWYGLPITRPSASRVRQER